MKGFHDTAIQCNRDYEIFALLPTLVHVKNKAYILNLGHIGRTFYSKSDIKMENDLFVEGRYKKHPQQFGFDETKEEYRHSRWCYDTPGTIQPDQVLDLLTMQELLSVLPKKIISPRTFVLHKNQTIFLGGIGRLDYAEGDSFIRYLCKFTIIIIE